MISGYGVAGGLELALWCGLRVTGTTAIFGVFCRPLRSPIDRRRNGASTAPDRSIADDGHDPDRTSGQCGRSRSEEHTSELQSLMRISYAVLCLKKKKQNTSVRYQQIESAHTKQEK